MKKLDLLVTVMMFIFASSFVACNDKHEIDGDRMTPIKVNKDTFMLKATADSSLIEATQGAYIKNMELITSNDTIINNTTHGDTISSKWCNFIKIKESPATFRIYVTNNSIRQKRKAILTLGGVCMWSTNVTIIQQAN